MRASTSWQGYIGLGLLAVLGSGLMATHVFCGLRGDETLLGLLVGVVPASLLTAGLLVGTGWVWRSELPDPCRLRIGTWSLAGALFVALGAVLSVLHARVHGASVGDPIEVIANWVAIGGLMGFVVGLYDVRQQQSQRRAEQLVQRQTVLNRILRHDIRNKANIISGWASQLDAKTDSETPAARIQKQATALVRVGEQARLIEKYYDAGADKTEVVSIVDRLEGQVAHFQDVYPSVSFDVSLPAMAAVYAHPLIGSALNALLENAIVHNHSDDPEVAIRPWETERYGPEYVTFQIVDNGPGIPKSELNVLDRGFETQLEHASGLGLWIANWVITAGGGELRFATEDVAGTAVCIALERAPPGARGG